jgi:DNA-binding GntR family transcriptional regulator
MLTTRSGLAQFPVARPSTRDAFAPGDLAGTLPIQIAVRLGQAIIDERFRPGEKLREVELAQSFGVSRASVREALRLVEREGLVRILPQRGARVTELSAEEVRDVFEIRSALMGLACARLAERADAATVRELHGLLAKLNDALADPEAYARASLAVGEFCVVNAGSIRLATLILSFGRQTARYNRLTMAGAERRQRSFTNWQRLAAAVERGDASQAEAISRRLVLDTRDAAVRLLESQASGSDTAVPQSARRPRRRAS